MHRGTSRRCLRRTTARQAQWGAVVSCSCTSMTTTTPSMAACSQVCVCVRVCVCVCVFCVCACVVHATITATRWPFAFSDNQFGIYTAEMGNFYARNSRFERSASHDLYLGPAAGNGIHRCVSQVRHALLLCTHFTHTVLRSVSLCLAVSPGVAQVSGVLVWTVHQRCDHSRLPSGWLDRYTHAHTLCPSLSASLVSG